jgi:hypothetical protein
MVLNIFQASIVAQGFRSKFIQPMAPRIDAHQSKIMEQGQMVLEGRNAAGIEASSEQLYRLSVKHSLAGRQRKIAAALHDYFSW